MEVRAYPIPPAQPEMADPQLDMAGVLLPLRLRTAAGILSFVSTVTLFGTPHDITLQELAIETFFPADDFTAAELSRLAAS